MQLIKYRHSDGQIEAIWSSNTRALLEGHVTENDADFGYLYREEETVAAAELVARWHIHKGQFVAKEEDL